MPKMTAEASVAMKIVKLKHWSGFTGIFDAEASTNADPRS